MFPDVSDDAVKPERSTGVSQLQFEAFSRYNSTAPRLQETGLVVRSCDFLAVLQSK